MPFADFLTQTARIRAKASRRQGFGEGSDQFADVAGQEAVPCLVRPLRAEALARQGRDAALTWVRIYFDADYGLTNNSLIVVDGLPYSVRGQVDFNSMHEVYSADCVQTRT